MTGAAALRGPQDAEQGASTPGRTRNCCVEPRDSATPANCLAAPGTYSPTATIVVDESITLTTADPYATTKPIIDGGGTLSEIIKIAADNVTIDGNHPLAGMPLNFDVEILGVREATEQEVSHGHAH